MAVSKAMVRHLPDTSATEAYYFLVVQHMARLLWRVGAGRHVLAALGTVMTETTVDLRDRLREAAGTADAGS